MVVPLVVSPVLNLTHNDYYWAFGVLITPRHHETWETFAVGSLTNPMTLLSLSSLSVVVVASPLTYLCSDLYLSSLILFRRKWLDHDDLASNPLLIKLASVSDSIVDRWLYAIPCT